MNFLNDFPPSLLVCMPMIIGAVLWMLAYPDGQKKTNRFQKLMVVAAVIGWITSAVLIVIWLASAS